VAEDVHVVGLSVLSGSHLEVVPAVIEGLRTAGAGDVPVVVGGIIPPDDADALRAEGVAQVFTPKDFELTEIMDQILNIIQTRWGRVREHP
jgi:(2R)-ethylmalonyl-CoA mutase